MEAKDPNRLNRSRPYGTVAGDPNVGYEQDGKLYDHTGRLYIPPDGKTPEKPEDIPRKTLSLRNDKLREIWDKKLGQQN